MPEFYGTVCEVLPVYFKLDVFNFYINRSTRSFNLVVCLNT